MSDGLRVAAAERSRVLTLDRPSKLNALSMELLDALRRQQEELITDGDCNVVVLRGAGRAFCCGADLEFVRSIREDPAAVSRFLTALRDTITGFERLPQTVVAAVHGMVLAGGLELMMGCDIVLATETCRLGDQHANYGLVPGGGGTQRLPRLVGRLRAKELILTGRWVSAQEAAAMGLVTRVVADAALDSELDALVRSLSDKSATAAAASKRLIDEGMDLPLARALDLEIEAVERHFASRDMEIGLAAFASRETPAFPPRAVDGRKGARR